MVDRIRSPLSPTERIRVFARQLVDHEARSRLSRMEAYDTVAKSVGASVPWLRRFITGGAQCSLSYPVGLNIEDLYARLCTHIETAAAVRDRHAQGLELEARARRAGLDTRLPPGDSGEGGVT